MKLTKALATAFAQREQARGGHTPKALLGQLLDIARNTEQGRAGKPAAALGVSPATWNKWLSGAKGLPGGSTPSAASQRKIEAAVKNIHKPQDSPVPSRARISADVRWNGYPRRGERKGQALHRTIHLDDLDLEAAYAAYQNDNDPEEAFLQAFENRYGVPIELDNIDSIELT